MNKENVVYKYNKIFLSHKKNEILPFAAIWMNLENVTLSEVNQTKANIIYHSYVESKK